MRHSLILFCIVLSTVVFGQVKKTTATTSSNNKKVSTTAPVTTTVAPSKTVATTASKTVIVPPKVPTDTLIKLGGRKISIIYKQESSNEITYTLVSKPDSFIKISKKEIEWIIFKTGRRKQFNKPVLSAVSDDQWQTVMITKDRSQTEGLYKVGFVEKTSKPQSTKKKAFENAVVLLQRAAIVYKAYIVLIEEEYYPGGYGDPPVCHLSGSCWGMEPAEKGTNVTKDSKK